MLNVCLFPPLFFFYALYYTDVASTLSVLYVYGFYLNGRRGCLVVAGLVSLWFRQTNIFWISIFTGALDLTKSLSKGRPGIEYPAVPSLGNTIYGSWSRSCIYDGPVNQATFAGLYLRISLPSLLIVALADYVKSALSIVVASLSDPRMVVRVLWPYLTLLGAFGSFIIWNGGVVLGKLSLFIRDLQHSVGFS